MLTLLVAIQIGVADQTIIEYPKEPAPLCVGVYCIEGSEK